MSRSRIRFSPCFALANFNLLVKFHFISNFSGIYSPFILRTDEDKKARLQASKIQHSNIEPNTGGMDVDDLESVAGSCAEAVVVEDVSSDEEDDDSVISELEDETGSNEDEDDLQTQGGNDSDEEMVDVEDSDSVFGVADVDSDDSDASTYDGPKES